MGKDLCGIIYGVVGTTHSGDIRPFFKPSGSILITRVTSREQEGALDDREV